MHTFRRFAKPVTFLLMSAFLTLSLHMPAAQAALIGTGAVVNATAGHEARARVRAALDRDDIRQALVERGVKPGDVQARVDALSDDEAVSLSARIDQLPAGGDTLGLLVFVFIVLLITDILGFTDIFPFVKKHGRR